MGKTDRIQTLDKWLTNKNNSKTNRKARLHVHYNRLKAICGGIKSTIKQPLTKAGNLTIGDIWYGDWKHFVSKQHKAYKHVLRHKIPMYKKIQKMKKKSVLNEHSEKESLNSRKTSERRPLFFRVKEIPRIKRARTCKKR
jgi:hypothetical protein